MNKTEEKKTVGDAVCRIKKLLAEGKTAEADQLLHDLLCAWDRSFLNYTPEAPDHWCDPESEFEGNLEQPEHALPLLEFLFESSQERYRDRVQAYFEYVAAVWRQHFSGPARQRLLLLLHRAAEAWQDRKEFAILAEAMKKSLD